MRVAARQTIPPQQRTGHIGDQIRHLAPKPFLPQPHTKKMSTPTQSHPTQTHYQGVAVDPAKCPATAANIANVAAIRPSSSGFGQLESLTPTRDAARST